MELKSGFKLSLLFLAIASPAAPVLAASPSCPLCSFAGLSVGTGLGVDAFMGTISTSSGGGFTNLDPTQNTYKLGAVGSIFLGYGYVSQEYMYVGAEVGASFYGSNRTSLKKQSATDMYVDDDAFGDDVERVLYNNNLDVQTRTTRSAVEPFLDLKIGRLMAPNLLAYLRGGISYNTMTMTSDSSYLASGKLITFGEFGDDPRTVLSANTVGSSLNHAKKDHLLGARLGGGFEYMVTPNFGIASDYVYTFYQNIKSSGLSEGKDVACDFGPGTCEVFFFDFTNTSRAKMSDQRVTAEMIYHFNG